MARNVSSYTKVMGEEILAWIRLGRPLAAFCRLEGKPAYSTVWDWLQRHEAFAEAYAAARRVGFDYLAEECLMLGDGVRADRDHVAKAKLQIETRLKLLAKWDPKRFGDKVNLQHTDGEGGPVTVRFAQTVGEAVQDPATTQPTEDNEIDF